MKKAIYGISAAALLTVGQYWVRSNVPTSSCVPISTDGYIGHVDYSNGIWVDTNTDEIIGYSLTEDSEVYAIKECI